LEKYGTQVKEEIERTKNLRIRQEISSRLYPAQVLEEVPSYGSIEVGKAADLLLVEENPLQRISDTQNIVVVMQAGVLISFK
jgi:hypothetical protein